MSYLLPSAKPASMAAGMAGIPTFLPPLGDSGCRGSPTDRQTDFSAGGQLSELTTTTPDTLGGTDKLTLRLHPPKCHSWAPRPRTFPAGRAGGRNSSFPTWFINWDRTEKIGQGADRTSPACLLVAALDRFDSPDCMPAAPSF